MARQPSRAPAPSPQPPAPSPPFSGPSLKQPMAHTTFLINHYGDSKCTMSMHCLTMAVTQYNNLVSGLSQENWCFSIQVADEFACIPQLLKQCACRTQCARYAPSPRCDLSSHMRTWTPVSLPLQPLYLPSAAPA